MRNIKLILEYDGSDFHGWQIQKNARTVEGELTKALKEILGNFNSLVASGRTDAGVHALGQVVNFFTENPMDLNELKRALNAVLPDTISVLSACEVDKSFHSRFSAKKRTYRYVIYNRDIPSPFWRKYAWQIVKPLDVEKAKEALKHLIGTHDFSAFRSSDCTAKTPIRTIYNIDVVKSGHIIEIYITASSFLRRMVRKIIGLLFEILTHKNYEPTLMRETLWKRVPIVPFRSAPPYGLYLYSVEYDEEK